ncbi:MAG: dihydrolipoyllysine-residue succinyltransferase [Acidobacteriia bacterium]|jgi:2-oxoglutarate dehydrogenase complex dihydrolipoamide succinyltransferase (E2) component|nr:dihydrolipoyllysine-residue succinyltransferase [Terriglobia bacterium]
MSSDVIMPQMGESIFEGTIIKWLKAPGEKVKRDEPLFEISTDKVDSEIPAPASGILREIRFQEGDTVEINTVVAVIDDGESQQMNPEEKTPQRIEKDIAIDLKGSGNQETKKPRSSPLVKRLAKEEGIDLNEVEGSGLGGRITKADIMNYLSERENIAEVTRPLVQQAQQKVEVPTRVSSKDKIVPMSAMRLNIAEHMVGSKSAAAHVTTVFEVDMTSVVKIKIKETDEFYRSEGVKLSFTPFFVKAVANTLVEYPVMNASIKGNDIIYKKDINIGLAVALTEGLIVPVIFHADQKSLMELARNTTDIANRAREKKLNPQEVQGGTFTITNPGIFGSLFGTPIINQPQVAILCIGAINKRPVVINDAIAIRSMAYLSLTFDHRLIDGSIADGFMSSLKKRLELWEEESD